MPASYFLGSAYLGQVPRLWWDAAQMSHVSLAFFCPRCGEIWARAHDTAAAEWHVITRGCTKHPTWAFEPGGLLSLPWFKSQDLPLPVLEREFHLWYEHHKRLEALNGTHPAE